METLTNNTSAATEKIFNSKIWTIVWRAWRLTVAAAAVGGKILYFFFQLNIRMQWHHRHPLRMRFYGTENKKRIKYDGLTAEPKLMQPKMADTCSIGFLYTIFFFSFYFFFGLAWFGWYQQQKQQQQCLCNCSCNCVHGVYLHIWTFSLSPFSAVVVIIIVSGTRRRRRRRCYYHRCTQSTPHTQYVRYVRSRTDGMALLFCFFIYFFYYFLCSFYSKL